METGMQSNSGVVGALPGMSRQEQVIINNLVQRVYLILEFSQMLAASRTDRGRVRLGVSATSTFYGRITRLPASDLLAHAGVRRGLGQDFRRIHAAIDTCENLCRANDLPQEIVADGRAAVRDLGRRFGIQSA